MAEKFAKATPMRWLFISDKLRSLGAAVFAFAFLAFSCQGLAETLSNRNSTVTLDLSNPAGAGMTSWTVDGQNVVSKEWYYFRIGSSGGEAPISSISAPAISQSIAKLLTVNYANANLSVQVVYNLSGGANGFGKSGMTEQIAISNTSSNTEDLHFFRYTAMSLAPGGNDTVTLFNTSIANQTNGAAWAQTSMTQANHGETEANGSILTSLNDGSPTTLSDNTTSGPGNVNWAFEWDTLNLAPGSGVQISVVGENIQVPEPSTFAIIALGLVGWTLSRRRQH
jgi:hypothetical protein